MGSLKVVLNVAGDYLYISGQRYDLKTGKFEYLSCAADVEYKQDSFGITALDKIGPMNISWKEYSDIKEDDKGIKIYL